MGKTTPVSMWSVGLREHNQGRKSGEEVTGAAQARDDVAWVPSSDIDVGTGQIVMPGIAGGERA